MPQRIDTIDFDDLSSDPGAPGDGQLWYNSTQNDLKTQLAGSIYVLATSKVTITAGGGLTGGGDLSTSRTIDIAAADGSIQVNANSIQVGTISGSQHGNLTGGSLHNLVSSSSHGFQPQSNRAAVVDPGVNDDSAAGYEVGSYWVNTSSGVIFGCVDNSAGAAVWVATAAMAILTSTAPSDVTKAAAAVGVGTTAARHDHKHDVDTASAADITDSTNSEGTATSLARSDHSHSHGNRSGGSLHALATTVVAGFLSAADKTTIDGLGTTYVPLTRTLTAGAGMTGGGDLSADRTFDVVANADGSITVNANDIQVGVLASDAQHGSRGGGSLHAVATVATAGFMSAADKTTFDAIPSTYAIQTRTITAGAGLTGGGDLSADRTINVVANVDGSITVNADDIQVGILASDSQHGNRGGGSLHALVSASAHGFQPQSNRNATVAPTVNDDSSAGYDIGSYWVNLSTDAHYVCVDNSVGAAVWATTATTPLATAAPADVAKSAAVVGVSTDAARADHKHDISTAAGGAIQVGATGAEGSASTLARSDHTHTLTAAAPVNVTKAANSAGSASTFSRSDHKHDITTAVASTIGTANAEGSSTSLARSDHVHDHGAQALGTGNQHAVATTSIAGFLSSTDKTKLDSLSSNAAPGVLYWGNEKIETSTTTRYLTPGADLNRAAETLETRFAVPFACTLRNLYITHNVVGSGAQTVTYTVLKNGVATSLAVAIAPGAASGSDTSNTVSFSAGDTVSVRVTKSATLDSDPENVMASLEVSS